MDRENAGVNESSAVAPFLWHRALALVRLLLALSALVILVRLAAPSGILARLLLGAFVGYASWLLFWTNGKDNTPAVLVFVLDCVYFLVCATIDAPATTWLSAALFLFLMIAGVLFHRWQHILIAGVVCGALFPLIRTNDSLTLIPAFSAATILALVGSWQREAALERLGVATHQASESRAEIEKARETERERIAADFHDGPMQSFISLQMRLEIVRRMLERDAEAAKAELLQLLEVTKSQVTDVRAFVRGMRPFDVSGEGFTTALSQLVASFQKDTGISATFLGAGGYESEDIKLGRELLKIVREALHNTLKHAGASRVAVGIECSNGDLEVLIQDDGDGFQFAGTYSLEELELLGIGPESIKKRVRSLGGDLVVESRPGLGAGLKIRVPL